MKIKVLIVDDSAVMRNVLAELLSAQADMQVIGMAHDAWHARELIKQTNPDVVTLDVEMPGMDGLDFLERLMRLRPTPVVMVSSATESGSHETLRALELGAVDFIAKPRAGALGDYAELLAEKVRTAAKVQVSKKMVSLAQGALSPLGGNMPSGGLVAIGASTGGTEAIRDVLIRLPVDCPPIVIAQHMPPGFTQSFAQRLNDLCKIAVSEARDDELALSGHAYVAPGHSHLLVIKRGTGYALKLAQTEPVNRHRPSVDVLFNSVALAAGASAVGIILTGMGKDGARGLLEMREAGAYTLAQDEMSCVVFGMPREAIAIGAADEIVALPDMATRLMAALRARAGAKRIA